MNNRYKVYVGIDIHSREHTAAIIEVSALESPGEPWSKMEVLHLANSLSDFQRLDEAISSRVSSREEATIAVDYTGGYYSEPLVNFLQERGYIVYYLETKAVKAARERFLDQANKSDKIDAASAAYLLYLRDTHGLSFRISSKTADLGSKATVLRSLVLQRWQFVKLSTQATNRLRQLLVAVFPEGEAKYFRQLLKILPYYPTPEDILASDGLKEIRGLRNKCRQGILELAARTVGVHYDSYRWLIRDLSMQRNESLEKCAKFTSALERGIEEHSYGRVLLSFPFLGVIAAAIIIGIIADIDRWPNKKKFKKALGVYTNVTQSGTHMSYKRGKEGSREGRRVLFQICLGCIRGNARENDFKDYYLRQVSKGKPKMKALVATMGKLAEVIYHCLKAGEAYQYQGKYKSPVALQGNRQ